MPTIKIRSNIKVIGGVRNNNDDLTIYYNRLLLINEQMKNTKDEKK